jgi:hypothetical protein
MFDLWRHGTDEYEHISSCMGDIDFRNFDAP